MISPADLRTGSMYRCRRNQFRLFREYDPNIECFQRHDGSLHYGREFIEYRNGVTVLDLVPDDPH